MKDQSLRVLMVEDSEDDELLIIRELKKGGYNPVHERVETASTMKKALKEKQWDIILCDYSLPTFNAPSVIAELIEANIDIPLIIVTGKIGEEMAAECMRLGAQDYIMKGNMSRLCPAITRELEEVEVRNKQKQAESQREAALILLRENEEFYRTIFENTGTSMILIEEDMTISMANEEFVRNTGYSLDEINGRMKWTEIVHPDDLGRMIEKHRLRRGSHGGALPSYEFRYITKTDDLRDAFLTIRLVPGTKKSIASLIDITERKKAEEKLNREEQRFKILSEQSSDIILLINREKVIIYENSAVDKILGLKRDERIGKNVLENLHPDDLHIVLNAFNTLIGDKNASSQRHEIRVRHADGSLRTFEAVASNLIHENIVEAVIINLRDISERRKAEEALKNSELKYRDIFENAIEGIYQSTIEGRFMTANAALVRMAGYDSPAELIESIKDIETQLYVHPEDRKRLMEIMEAKGFVEGFEVEFYKKDGSTFWVVINARTVKDEQGKVLYIEGLIEDITVRKHSEEQLYQTLENLRKSFEATIHAMVSATEMRDPYTAGHQLRSAKLACAIATEMGLPNDKIEGIRMAGAIHDIGKLSVPAEILSKPTKLTNIEFSLIKEHSKIGYEMLKDVESPWPLAQIVYQHHERMNGSGYPRNLKGDEIFLESRILAVADVVEAMASHRPYRAALGIDAALEEIVKNKGIFYDDAVADACLKLFREKGYQLS